MPRVRKTRNPDGGPPTPNVRAPTRDELTARETAIRQLIAEGRINLGPLSWEGGSFHPTGPVAFHHAPDDGGAPMPMADIARKKAK